MLYITSVVFDTMIFRPMQVLQYQFVQSSLPTMQVYQLEITNLTYNLTWPNQPPTATTNLFYEQVCSS